MLTNFFDNYLNYDIIHSIQRRYTMKNNIKESWMHKYSLAKAYFEYHGNLEISQSYKNLRFLIYELANNFINIIKESKN